MPRKEHTMVAQEVMPSILLSILLCWQEVDIGHMAVDVNSTLCQ